MVRLFDIMIIVEYPTWSLYRSAMNMSCVSFYAFTSLLITCAFSRVVVQADSCKYVQSMGTIWLRALRVQCYNIKLACHVWISLVSRMFCLHWQGLLAPVLDVDDV